MMFKNSSHLMALVFSNSIQMSTPIHQEHSKVPIKQLTLTYQLIGILIKYDKYG